MPLIKRSPRKKSKVKKIAPAKAGKEKKAAPAFTDIEPYRKKLESMREDLLKVVQKKREEVLPDSEVGDEADTAVRSVARDLVFELSGNERHLLEEVEAAIRRIEKGTYGFCESDRKKIKIQRLKVMPYARYCIHCQSRFETH